MAGELQITHTTGQTVYAQVFDETGQVWDAVAGAWDPYATGAIDDYDISLTELGTASQVYTGTFPATIEAGSYWVHYRDQAGGSVAESDTIISTARVEWNGSGLQSRASWANMSPDIVGPPRLWIARHDFVECREIVECTTSDTAVYAMDFSAAINGDAVIATAVSVSDTSGNSLSTSGLSIAKSKTQVHFSVSSSDLTADTTYNMLVTITTTDGDQFGRVGLLKCVS